MTRVGVVTFPGTLDERDAARAVEIAGAQAVSLWHKDADLHGVDAVVIPGGFSDGDYLRCGAIAATAPVMSEIVREAGRGLPVLGGEGVGRVDGDAERASFDHGRFAKGGLGGEVVLHIQDGQTGSDSDAVPLVETMDGDVVAGLLKGFRRELVGAALNFLHGQHVRTRALEESNNAVDARADGVDIPGRKSHGVEPIGGGERRPRETRVKQA